MPDGPPDELSVVLTVCVAGAGKRRVNKPARTKTTQTSCYSTILLNQSGQVVNILTRV